MVPLQLQVQIDITQTIHKDAPFMPRTKAAAPESTSPAVAQRVQALLLDVEQTQPERFATLQAVRQLALGLHPTMREEVKYGGILFAAGTPFCGVFAYSEHVSLEFSKGAALADPYQVLEGAGKLRRHIKLTNPDDVASKQVAHYLAQALQAA